MKANETASSRDQVIRGLNILLLIINGVTFVFGFIILVMGSVYHSQHEPFNEMWEAGSSFCSAAAFCIFVGFFTCLISFVGFYGALKQNYCWLLMFSALLGFVVLAEFILGVTLFAMARENSLQALIASAMKKSMKKFVQDNQSHGSTKGWNILQTEFRCCGVYASSEWHTDAGSASFQPPYLPDSCCESLQLGEKCQVGQHDYSDGCLPKLMLAINKHGVDIGAVVVVFGFTQIALIIFAVHIMRKISRPRSSCPPFY